MKKNETTTIQHSRLTMRRLALDLCNSLRQQLTCGHLLRGLFVALASGFLLPLLLREVMTELKGEYPAPEVASTYLLAFLLSVLFFAVLPLGRTQPFRLLGLSLQLTLLGLAAFSGLKIAAGTALSLVVLIALSVWVLAHALASCGFYAILMLFLQQAPQAARACLLLVAAATMTSILWTKPFLLAMSKDYPQVKETATALVLYTSPISTLITVWNQQQPRFDIVKGRNTYHRWIGAYDLYQYPQLWPGRSKQRHDPEAPWQPGLFLVLIVTGGFCVVLHDLLRWRINAPDTPVNSNEQTIKTELSESARVTQGA